MILISALWEPEAGALQIYAQQCRKTLSQKKREKRTNSNVSLCKDPGLSPQYCKQTNKKQINETNAKQKATEVKMRSLPMVI